MNHVYLSYAEHLKQTYNRRVYRIGVDGQFSCPNRNADGSGGCAFCEHSGSIAAYQNPQDVSVKLPCRLIEQRIAHVLEQIESGKRFLVRRYKAEAFALYFQSYTNTFDTLVHLKALYDAALSSGEFVELIISTRPDCLSDEVVALLKTYTDTVEKVWVELGLQSANQAALDLVDRNHDVFSYIQGVNSLHLQGVGVCTHIMLGLPLDGFSSYRQTAKVIN
ncbi:MAG: TIGR01212 family radical SAM protein, partial [Spirochaetia bacterium]|nr:TIGR01212 family radical SAM protein [Spirochaetia bacterium]